MIARRCDALFVPEQETGGLQTVDSLQWYVWGYRLEDYGVNKEPVILH